MQIKDNKNEIPLSHYKTVFAAKDPSEMSFRSGVPFENGKFRVNLLGRPVEVSHPEMDMRYVDNGSSLRPNATILIARLITEGSIIAPGGKMLSYSEMPWGNVYLAQFTGRCIMRLAFGFANFQDKFAAACESVGGKPVKGGDAAYDIELVNSLTMRLIVWEGEDDIPPSAQILFSDNFPAAFSAEDMAVAGDILLDAMKGKW